jgi:predicted small integral membrane protein
MDRDKIFPTIVVFGGIILVLVVIVNWISAMDDCRARKGVLTNTFLGYACVEPRK